MSLFNILSKRRKFIPLYEQVWQAITPQLTISAGPEDEIAHRLECFFYAGILYSAVYQSAMASGMNSSSAFSVARIQLEKSPFDSALCQAVNEIFSADSGSPERRYADRLQEAVGRIVATITSGQDAPAVLVAAELEELAQFFSAEEFAREGLYPPLSDSPK